MDEEEYESIYRGGFVNLPKPEWGYYTKDGKNFTHMFSNNRLSDCLTGIHREQPTNEFCT